MADLIVDIELNTIYEPSQGIISDSEAPTVSNETLTVSNKTETGWDVQFTKATDNITSQTQLIYELYTSDTSNLIADAETVRENGTLEDQAQDVSSLSVTGLDPQTQKFFNVVVDDGNNNASIYDENSDTTFEDDDSPTISNSGLTTSNIGTSGWNVDYEQATDNVTAQKNLFYELYISDSDNLDTDANTVRTNGTLADQGTGISTLTVSGLNEETQRYFNVVVEDEAENVDIYTSNSETTNSSSTVDSRAGDEQALESLWNNSTNQGSWNDDTGWSSNMSLDNTIYGVTTNTINGELRVTEIDLWDNNVESILPIEIGNLTQCTYLNIKKNSFTGSIPTEIGSMGSIEWLILSGRTDMERHKEPPPETDTTSAYHSGKTDTSTNTFDGQIPSTIGNLSTLKHFELSGSDCTNIPPELGNCSQLVTLYMNHNLNLQDSLPEEYSNLSNLMRLGFRKCANNTIGPIPSSYSQLTDLVTIYFNETQLSGDLPDMSNMTDIVHVFFNKCEIGGQYPQYFNNGNFTQIRHIYLAANNLTGKIPYFDNLPDLQALTFSFNNFDTDTEAGDKFISTPSQLQIFSGVNCGLAGELPSSGYPDWHNMKTLHLEWNNMTGHIPCEFWDNVDNTSLSICRLDNNDFDSNCTSSMNDVQGDGDPNINVSGNNF